MPTHLAVRRPAPAETARTLASGVVPATVLLPGPATGGRPATMVGTRPFAGTDGALYLLAGARTEARRQIRAATSAVDGLDVAVLVDMLDVPPVRTDLPRARLSIAGWVEPLSPEDARTAALDLIAARPTDELLAVCEAATLFLLHPAELCLTTADGTHDVGVEVFHAATPDPLYENESDVVAHLQHHHYDDLSRWARAHLGDAAHALRQFTLCGVDRYGVDLDCRLDERNVPVRLAFGAPVPDEESLGEALRTLDRCPCGEGRPTGG